MIGTTLVREAPSPIRPGPSRPNALPPVLIEVPALPGSRPRHARPSARRVAAEVRPRRRLRREVRLAALMFVLVFIVAALASSAAIVLRDTPPVPDEATPAGPIVLAEPFAIELEQPIPEPVDPIGQDGWVEGLPVAFPGYLLPGDGVQEAGHERP